MKYIEQAIENEQGYTVSCWVAVAGSFSLSENQGRITLVGWKDVDAYKAKKAPSDQKIETFALSDLQNFEAVWGEIASKLVTASTNFRNAQIKDTNAQIKDTTTEEGETVQ